eukprot:gene10858-3477_t
MYSSGSITPESSPDTPTTPIFEETIPIELEPKDLDTKEKKNFTLKVNNVSKLTEHFSNYFNSKDYSDVTFKIEGKLISAHKFLLASRSKKFAEIFSDGKDTYEVSDVSYEIFFDALQFAYTGKIDIDYTNSDKLIVCADKYGIVALKVCCFEFKVKSIDKDSAITTIMSGKNNEFEYDATELIDLCFKFIEKHTHEVVKTKTFTHFDEEAVVTICKNGELVIGESDLFDGVLKWGNYMAKFEKKTLEEVLKNILPLIRFPMMERQYLEKTVKPLNLVSKDELKEALEFQNNPDKFKKDKSEKFKPRGSLFIGGTLIQPNEGLVLDSYLKKGKGKIWKCIYKATKDGFSDSTFHQHCDNKGGTFTVVKSTNGYIFGGYCPLPWSTNGSYQYDKDSFMFSLKNSKNKIFKFDQTTINGNSSIYCCSGYGPTFGGGHDLYIYTNSNSNTSSYSNFGYNYDSNVIGSYGSTQAQNFLAGSYNFQTVEIEVYSQK